MIHVASPKRFTRHGASDLCRRRHRFRRVVAAGAVSLVIAGCGANEAGGPAIAVAATNAGVHHHDFEWKHAAVSHCTVCKLMDESTEDGAAFKGLVRRLMRAATSAIYSRRCGSKNQYRYIDIRNDNESCVSGPIPHTTPPGEVTVYFYLDLDRCR